MMRPKPVVSRRRVIAINARARRVPDVDAVGFCMAGSVLQSPRRRELLYHSLLLFGQLVGNLNGDLDDQVSLLLALLDSLPAHPKTLARRGARRNPERALFAVERADADLGTKRRLGDVERHRCDDVESV